MKIDIKDINEFEYKGFILRLRWSPKWKRKSFGYNKEPKEGMWAININNNHSDFVYSKSVKNFIFECLPSERENLEDTRFTIKQAIAIIDKIK